MTDELSLLREANPVRAGDPSLGDEPLDRRALDELDHLVSDAFLLRRPRRRLVAAAAGVAFVVTALAVLGVQVLSPSAAPAMAATPPLLSVHEPVAGDPAAALRGIAADARAADALAATLGTGPADGAERGASWQSWSLATQVDGEQVDTAVIPEVGTMRWTPEQAATVRVTAGEAYFPTEEHRRAWERAGQPGRLGTLLAERFYPQGRFEPLFPTPPPTTAEAMAAYLRTAHPVDEHGPAALVVAVADLQREWTLGPGERAAVLEVLADAPGLLALGDTTDRLGRDGRMFAVDSAHTGLPTRYVLLVEPGTGRVLATEEWLTSDAGELDVPVPSVVSYAVWGD